MTGRLYGVGLGPGDPELVTLKAARLIREADVVAYHAGRHGSSIARSIAADLIRDGVVEEQLVYPVTTGTAAHPGGYAGAMADFYAESAARLAAHLEAGRDVVLLAEGDPLFYGSYMYMHDRLADRFHTEVVPGVTSVAAASAAVASPLVRQTDVLTVLPGTMPEPELARRLADTQGAVIMKLGRTFPAVLRALEAAGRDGDAYYVERASTDRQVVLPVKDVDPAKVPYFSIIVVAGDSAADAARYDHAAALRSQGGPAPDVTRTDGSEAKPTTTTDLNRSGLGDAGLDDPAGAVARVWRAERSEAGVPGRVVETRGAEDTTGARELLVVGLGPAGEGWLTPEVAAALDDVDHVVGYAPYVNRVPQRPGLRRHASGNTVELDRARLALDLARSGERVAVVSGGDAGVFGMASAVFEAAQDAAYDDVRVRVLPGMTAVQAVAARAGAPLGGDFSVLSLSDRLKPWPVIAERLSAVARADLVLAVYNPASRSRITQVEDMRTLLLEHRPPGTVVVIGRDVGRDGERVEVTTLGELDAASIDMRCLLVVGSSGTQVSASGRVWTRRWVAEASPAVESPLPSH